MQKGTHGLTLGNTVKWHINCHTINAFGYSPKANPTLNNKTLFSINYIHKRQYDKWKWLEFRDLNLIQNLPSSAM